MSASTQITDTMEITISSLPLSIQNQIPYSIRSRKDVYQFSKLPKNIQYLVKNYIQDQKTVNYSNLFDVIPNITTTGDFTVIDNYFDLAVEYLRNYLTLSKGQYPFDPLFYSKLKYYIQTTDTSTRYTLVNNEINRIAKTLSYDLSIPIEITNIKIEKTDTSGISITYHVSITLKVNNESKNLSIEVV